MRINTYTRSIISLCLVLFGCIFVASLFLYNHGPRVRFIELIDDIEKSSLTQNSTFRIVFDRPLEQSDYSSSISITPELPFTAQTTTQSILITLNDNLRHDTKYEIYISPDIIDKSGKKMRSAYTNTIETEVPSYAFLERNYGPTIDSSFSETDANDHVKIAQLGKEPEIIFSYPQIRSFVANSSYTLVVVKDELKDNLYAIDTTSKIIKQIYLPQDGRIPKIVLSKRSATALFTVVPDYNKVTSEYYEIYANRVFSINLENEEILQLNKEPNTPLKAYELQLDTDGQVALVQDESQVFYIVNPFNDYEPIPIGSHNESFGFNENTTEILFRDTGGFSRYATENSDVTAVDFITDGYIQNVILKTNTIFYSISSYSQNSVKNSINLLPSWDGEEEVLWTNNNNESLSSFSPSYDNSLLAVQTNPEKCRFDDIGERSACKETNQKLIDVAKGELLEEFLGINFVWLP